MRTMVNNDLHCALSVAPLSSYAQRRHVARPLTWPSGAGRQIQEVWVGRGLEDNQAGRRTPLERLIRKMLEDALIHHQRGLRARKGLAKETAEALLRVA